MKQTKVGELMTKDVISIDPDLKVDIAVETMRANNIRRLPVINKSNRLVGMITLNGGLIAMSGAADEVEMDDNTMPRIRDVMADYVYTIHADQSVADAATLMINHRISALPVVDADRNVTGIITESDLFRFLAEQLSEPDK